MQEPGTGRKMVKSAVSQTKLTADSSIDFAMAKGASAGASDVLAGTLSGVVERRGFEYERSTPLRGG